MGAAEKYQNLLTPADGPAVEVINPDGQGALVLVCEHASARIPEALAGLGLDEKSRRSHAAWDPGALKLARKLSEAFDAPLVASRISRLVYDCNRPPESPEAMREQSELITIPGNRNLSPSARAQRVREIYQPFRDTLHDLLVRRAGKVSALITVHSFTPVYFGKLRDTEIGLLHDRDRRLATAMLAAAATGTRMKTELNQPYGAADGVTHTLIEHALPAGILNVMIEVRNDLVETDTEVEKLSDDLATMIEAGLQACKVEPDLTSDKTLAEGR